MLTTQFEVFELVARKENMKEAHVTARLLVSLIFPDVSDARASTRGLALVELSSYAAGADFGPIKVKRLLTMQSCFRREGTICNLLISLDANKLCTGKGSNRERYVQKCNAAESVLCGAVKIAARGGDAGIEEDLLLVPASAALSYWAASKE